MLGKLMKYEFKATARFFIPAYIAILILTVINRFFFFLSDFNIHSSFLIKNGLINNIINLISGITMFLYVIAICALFVFTFIIFVYRFYHNLLGDEGYLMMTLPVRPSQHIWAKLHVNLIWSIASFAICVLSILILTFSPELFTRLINNMPSFIQDIINIGAEYKVHIILYVLELIGLTFISLYATNMFYYACLALGHRFSKTHRILYSIGAYLVISFALQIIYAIGFVLVNFILEDSFFDLFAFTSIIHLYLIGTIIYSIIQFVIFYFITENTLRKKLNLQ